MTTAPPAVVAEALRRAAEISFPASCEPPVGPLLAALAAAVPTGGRVLELGTGAGVGTAWLGSGLDHRQDASLTTVEIDPVLADQVRRARWPAWVEVVTGDAEALLPSLGQFDLIFADALGGKWTGLHLTLAALCPGGVLLLDDMDVRRYEDAAHRATVERVAAQLATDPCLALARLDVGSGILLATRRRSRCGCPATRTTSMISAWGPDGPPTPGHIGPSPAFWAPPHPPSRRG